MIAHKTENSAIIAEIQRAQANVPKFLAITLAVDCPVNWARFAIPLKSKAKSVYILVKDILVRKTPFILPNCT